MLRGSKLKEVHSCVSVTVILQHEKLHRHYTTSSLTGFTFCRINYPKIDPLVLAKKERINSITGGERRLTLKLKQNTAVLDSNFLKSYIEKFMLSEL